MQKHDAPSPLRAWVLTVPTSCGSCILFGWRSGSLFTSALLYLFNPCLGILPHHCACRPARGLAGCGRLFFSSGSLSSRHAGLYAACVFFLLYRSRDGTRALWRVRNENEMKTGRAPDRQTDREMNTELCRKPVVYPITTYKFWVSTVKKQLAKVDKTKWHFKSCDGRKSIFISVALSCKFRMIRSDLSERRA